MVLTQDHAYAQQDHRERQHAYCQQYCFHQDTLINVTRVRLLSSVPLSAT